MRTQRANTPAPRPLSQQLQQFGHSHQQQQFTQPQQQRGGQQQQFLSQQQQGQFSHQVQRPVIVAQPPQRANQPLQLMIDGKQVVPASNNPLNVTYNRDFIARIDQSLGNAIFNTANSMGYRFAPLQGFPNEAQQQDLVNALHVLDQYKTPIRISEHQFIPIVVQHHPELQQQQQPLPSFTDTFLESSTSQNTAQQAQPTKDS